MGFGVEFAPCGSVAHASQDAHIGDPTVPELGEHRLPELRVLHPGNAHTPKESRLPSTVKPVVSAGAGNTNPAASDGATVTSVSLLVASPYRPSPARDRACQARPVAPSTGQSPLMIEIARNLLRSPSTPTDVARA